MESSTESPPSGHLGKRRRVDEDGGALPLRTSYDNNHAHDYARVHNGHAINNNNYYAPVSQNVDTGTCTPTEAGNKDNPEPSASAIEALSFDEMHDRYDEVGAACSGTCEWFFDGSEYKAWRNPSKVSEHHGFLWVVGKPGAGKSTLVKDAFIHGGKTFAQEQDHITASFFFDARAGSSGQLLQKSLQGLFRSLLHQLLKAQPHLADALKSRRLSRAREQGWPLTLLQNMFQDAVLLLGPSKLTCYVDALDECDESEARHMVSFFEGLGASVVEKGVLFFVLFSSRHYPHISIEHCLRLVLEDQDGHGKDIERYIKSKLRIKNSERARKFRDALKEKACGVFLWVVLVIPSLNADNARGDLDRLDRRLQETPGDLHQLFANILQRGSHDGSVLLLALQLLMFAQRPLTRIELYCAIWYYSRSENIRPWDSEAITPNDMNRYVLNSSKGLTELTKHKQPKVRFIHESVRDYLRSSGLQSLDPCLNNNLVGICHDRIKQCCYHYVLRTIPTALHASSVGTKNHSSRRGTDVKSLRVQTSNSYPFLSYALGGMLYHADSSHAAGILQDDFVFEFSHIPWSRLQNLLAARPTHRFTSTVSKDYIFALHRSVHLTEIWTRDNGVSTSIDCQERHKSSLGAALESGNPDVVQLLLDRGADPNSFASDRHDSTYSLLHRAILLNNRRMVKSLIDAGALSDTKGEDLGAATRGHQSIVEMLIDRETDVSSRNDLECNALLNAAGRGNEPVVSMLLDRGVGVNSWDEKGHTALHRAAKYGHRSIVSMLLDRGADINLQDRAGYTPLHEATRRGHQSVVSTLLDRRADIGLLTSNGSTAVHLAASRDVPFVLPRLLECGIDVNLQNEYGATALHNVAHSSRNAPNARTLLAHGADTSALDSQQRTPIQLAAELSRVDMAKVLLDHEVRLGNLHTQACGVIEGAINAARSNNNLEMIKMLEDYRARLSSEPDVSYL